jgi:hypothetical protein
MPLIFIFLSFGCGEKGVLPSEETGQRTATGAGWVPNVFGNNVRGGTWMDDGSYEVEVLAPPLHCANEMFSYNEGDYLNDGGCWSKIKVVFEPCAEGFYINPKNQAFCKKDCDSCHDAWSIDNGCWCYQGLAWCSGGVHKDWVCSERKPIKCNFIDRYNTWMKETPCKR